jgi:hypothetical protein
LSLPTTFFLALANLSIVGTASADEKLLGPFAAAQVTIDSFAGTLEISIGDADEISGRLNGPEESIAPFDIKTTAEGLLIRAPAHRSRSSVTVVGDTTVVASAGGSAEVTIGGIDSDDLAAARDEEPITLALTVPVGTALTIENFAGDATIAATRGPLMVILQGGVLQAVAARDPHLTIAGSGDIRLGEATGILTMAINGSGSIIVDGGATDAVSATINGAGSLRFDGHSKSAGISVNGAGTVDLAHVEARPVTRMAGAGSITVGNWR